LKQQTEKWILKIRMERQGVDLAKFPKKNL